MNPIQIIADCEVAIDGTGPTLFMVHGWPDSLHLWDRQVDVLSPHFRCVRMTLPGYHKPEARHRYSLSEVVEIIASVIDHVSPQAPVLLMLHDWGCFYGFNYYAQYPDRVSKIIALDIGDATWASETYLKSLTLSQRFMIASYQLLLAASWILPRPIGDFLSRRFAKLARAPSPSEKIGAHMNYPYADLWSNPLSLLQPKPVISIEVPLFFAYGKRSPIPFSSKEWRQALLESKDNRVQAFDCGHWIMVKRSTEFNEAVLEWLQIHTTIETTPPTHNDLPTENPVKS